MGKMPEAQNFLIPPRIKPEFTLTQGGDHAVLLSVLWYLSYLDSSWARALLACRRWRMGIVWIFFFLVSSILLADPVLSLSF